MMLWRQDTIGDRITALGRNNNFTTVRALAATGVVFSHSYFVTIPGWTTTDYGTILGFPPANHFVHAFFFLSGFLLTLSLSKTPDSVQFMVARVLRLTPSIVVSALVLSLIVGPLVTTLDWRDYFSRPELAHFVASIVSLWDISHGLPGVFETNPMPHDLYELLWTLRYEYLFCLGLIAAMWLGALRNRHIMLVAVAGFVALYIAFFSSVTLHEALLPLHHLMRFTAPFAFGALVYLYRDRIPYSVPIGMALAAIALALSGTGLAPLAGTLALCYLILLVGCSRTAWLRPTTWIGQFSYGVYIYGFPIQQIVIHLWPGLSPTENGMVSTLIVFPLAIVSWYTVEQPMLRWKRPISAAIRTVQSRMRTAVVSEARARSST